MTTLNSRDGRPYIFDLHSDMATDIAIRRARGERQVFRRRHYPRLASSGVKAVVAVLWVEPEYRQNSASRLLQLLGSLMADLEECKDCVQVVTDKATLNKALESGKVALFLGIEGMTFVEQWPIFESVGKQPNGAEVAEGQLAEQLLEALAVLMPFGLRHAILVWGERNQIASGPGLLYRAELGKGLTEFGKQVVRELESRKVLVDLSHLDDQSIDDVLEVAEGPILASHSNARALCEAQRNLIDRHIREIGRRNGVVGMNAFTNFIDVDSPTIDRFIDHAVYIAGMIGIDHVAFGFDFTDFLPAESGYGVSADVELRSVENVPKLIQRLRERGFSEAEIGKLAFTNAMRIMTT